MDNIQNAEMRELALSLPTIVMAAKAKSTTTKYDRGWSKWLDWCKDKYEIRRVPANPFHVAMYLSYVLKNSNNNGALTTAFYGIRWGHQINGFPSPTDHPFVRMTYEGAVRLCEKSPRSPKDPITPEILKCLFNAFNSDSLADLRFLLMCALGFFGFFRIEELLTVQLKDISIKDTHLEIFLEKAKNDQHRDGNIVYISRLESKYCPVALVEKFLKASKISISTHRSVFLIPKIIKIKQGHKVHISAGISYTRAREIFKEKLDNFDSEGNFGLHSLRSGGASAAAESLTDERLISKHGRWVSDRARNSYIKDSVQNRLKITRQLGL